MLENKKIKVVLCWHMHQPEYRNLKTGEYQLPWTYLHVMKDYVDMVAHLEAEPKARAVVNFAPILLEQIEDYTKQINGYLHDRVTIKDSLLAALVSPSIPADAETRLGIIKDCTRANRERQINRYPDFQRLIEMAEWLKNHQGGINYVNSQFITDILVWYHLAWMGETLKLSDSRIKRLIAQGSRYTLHDRVELLEIIGEIHSSLLNRYKSLAKRGHIELSVTPYAHPIMPLMLDIKTAHEAMPNAQLPSLDVYPGGENRVRWHLKKGIETFTRFFGMKPKGCWPSEGSISKETLEILSEFGFSWTASGGNVLSNSLYQSGTMNENVHHPFKIQDTDVVCFFRDDGLSDLIGFEYSKWHADDAVTNLVGHLENVATHGTDKVVSIIMDGENAWEYFPANGYYFLSALYKKLSHHHKIELTTFSDCLAANVEIKPLKKLVAGSWVYGTFSTWIGNVDKNRGWDMLGDAKWAFDKVITTGRLSSEKRQKAEIQLAICEGSDWFWWFGDYNPSAAVSDFEQQFRLNLTNLYDLLGCEPPSYLKITFTQGSGTPAMGGAMRPGVEVK